MTIFINSYNTTGYSYAKQAIPTKEKNKEWVINTIRYLDSFLYDSGYNNYRSTNFTKQVSYDLLNGLINRDDVENIITPFFLQNSEDKQMPVEYKHYDIISPRIRFLIGEEYKRPFRFYAVDRSNSSYSDYITKISDLLFEMLKSKHQMLSQGVAPEIAEMDLVKLQKHKSKNIKNIFEDQATIILEDLKAKLNLPFKFSIGLSDALASDEEFYHIYEKGGEPAIRNCNPLKISFDFEEDNYDASEARVIVEENYMSISAILDEFWDKLEPEDVTKLEELLVSGNVHNYAGGGTVNYYSEVVTVGEIGSATNQSDNRSADSLIVRRYEWKSMKKVGIIRYIDEYDQEVFDIVNEYYEVPEEATKLYIFEEDKDFLVWTDIDGKEVWYEEKWINEYWHATKISEDIIIDYGPNKYQRRHLDNPSICKSSYVGRIYTARNTTSVGLVERMKTLQYFFNFIMYETELAYMRASGRGFVMDLAQKPDNLTLEEFIYYLKSVGIAFIDSTTSTGFNQFTDFDLSVGSYINQNFELLRFIQMQMEMLSGIPDQRLGQIQASELVGNVNAVIAQSSAITEYIYNTHDLIKQDALNALLDLALQLYDKGKTIYYVTDDVGRMAIKLHEDLYSKSLGIHLSNSTLDDKNMSMLKQNAQGALQSGVIDYGTLAKITLSTSVNQIVNILEESQAEALQRQQQSQEAQSKAILEEKQLEHQFNIAEINEKIKGEIDLALINKSDEEYEKLQLFMEDKYKSKEIDIKSEDLQEKIRNNKANELLKERELAIKKLTAILKPKTSK